MASQPLPTAIFDLGFSDTSLQGELQGAQRDELRRLDSLNVQLRDLLIESGCCIAADMAPVVEEVRKLDMRTCNSCEIDLAREVGGAIAIIGWVQKVSNLILNINLVARNVTTGAVIDAGTADIRGNTDESWSRGLTYLFRNRMHPSGWQ
jgi:hypothetical protein